MFWRQYFEKIRQLATYIRARDFRKIVTEITERPYLQSVPYWVAAGLVGMLAVFYSSFFTLAISAARWFAAQPMWVMFVVSPICFFVSTWLVEKLAPAAGGTGVPQVTAALQLEHHLEKHRIDAVLSLRVCAVILASSLLATLGGGALGREGPMVHMGACLFYVVGRRFQQLWPTTEHRSWIIAGAACGIAAAFNAPLAGVVFAVEELAQVHFHRFRTVVITVAIIGGVVAQALSGKYLYLGFPKLETVTISSIPWAMLVGALCGILAIPFHKLLAIEWQKKVPNYFSTRLKFSLLMGIVVAGIVHFIDKNSLGGGISVVQDLLFGNDVPASTSLIIGRFAATLASHLSGVAGGFLAPSLALGAAIGSKISVLVSYPNHNLLVLVGMAAFLSAIIRAPFTAWVVVMEMTDRHSAIFPLMIASVISYGMTKVYLEQKPAALT